MAGAAGGRPIDEDVEITNDVDVLSEGVWNEASDIFVEYTADNLCSGFRIGIC